jgi:hypothetical protein
MLSLEQTASDWQDINPNVGTYCSEYQPWWVPTTGWYQLDKFNINKFSNMLSLEQTASDWQDLQPNVGTYCSEYQPWWVPTTGWYQP